MSNDHLPECERWFTNMPDSDGCPTCEMFRACEQRVEAEMDRAWTQTVALAVAHTRTSTLDAAREAVIDMDLHSIHPLRNVTPCSCLGPQIVAAIDALRCPNG